MPTGIEWTDETWNPLRARLLAEPSRIGWHCEHASPGCVNCYAETLNRAGRSAFTGTRLPYKPGHRKDVAIFLDEKKLLEPLRWRRPRKVFVCSMTDLFADFHSDAIIDRVFAVMALCPQHQFQVLTKRSDRMRAYFADPMTETRVRLRRDLARQSGGQIAELLQPLLPLPNVWLGVSVEDQQRADERIPDLLATPAAVRFLSCEPLLGPLNVSKIEVPHHCLPATATRDDAWAVEPLAGRLAPIIRLGPEEWELDGGGQRFGKIDWIICGGESGPGARPMHPDWARSLRDQCAAARVPFFFKQWGAWAPDCLCGGCARRRETPRPQPGRTGCMFRCGKKAAGRLLDGVAHDGMPEMARC